MYQFFLVTFVIIAIILIILIMLQQNNGNSMGGGFDYRSLGDMLNSGSFNDNITRVIVILAILFFVFSLVLGNMNSKCNDHVYFQNDSNKHKDENDIHK
ncbi:preprotein translocase, SecG subunit [Candidatus Blochmanniella vafra str. BVAF]|uniref:Protein-export membrane protein SecG n=1 Tax=Blochmanniella vafra (strain BVAF) TaxID=859654 RepID=E8Q6R9_BLOVB|nr:preprotein translocase subunit SecG [Candidatus Blochmannia vafer]ADV33510.1 preprotein translocase, SecG subunit [Candidatus Blochmannia vafer str. BVAF]